MNRIQIVIADDQRLFRESLRTVLGLEEDMEVVGLAEQAYELVEQLRPTLILMDVQMPVMDGIRSIKKIKSRFPGIHILILTTFTDDDYIIEGLAGGEIGYLLKDMDKTSLLHAIRASVQGTDCGNLVHVYRDSQKLYKRHLQQIGTKDRMQAIAYLNDLWRAIRISDD